MTTTRELNVTFTYEVNGQQHEFEYDLTGSEDADEILQLIADSYNDKMDSETPEEEKQIEAKDIELLGVTCSESIGGYETLENIFDFAEAFAECDQDPEIVASALECGVAGSDIDEAYQGSYRDDEGFAQEMAESLGAIDKDAGWPQNCIDWEFAAKELMYDYCEHGGHYFRNL